MKAIESLLLAGALFSGNLSAAEPRLCVARGFWPQASTIEEGAARGAADLTRAAGEYEYAAARAATELQGARRLHIENRLLAEKAYFERRLRNREYRAALAGPRTTPEQAARRARQSTPKRPNSDQVNPVTRKIVWPGALQDSCFARYRSEVQRRFEERSLENSGLGSQSHRRIDEAVRKMTATLKGRIRTYEDPAVYIVAKKFLSSLGHEARSPLHAEAVAAK